MRSEHERRGLLNGGNVKRPRQRVDIARELRRADLTAIDAVLILLADGGVACKASVTRMDGGSARFSARSRFGGGIGDVSATDATCASACTPASVRPEPC